VQRAFVVERSSIYLARVVVNAMIDTTEIDDAQLIVKALTELDGPHISALVKLVAADDANQADPGNSDEILQAALEAMPAPVLAMLVLRAGGARPGGWSSVGGCVQLRRR
jgi:hypothetical protein